MELAKYADKMLMAETEGAVIAAFSEAIAKNELGRYIFGCVSGPLVAKSPLIFGTTYPDDWIRRYRDNDYVRLDPAVLVAAISRRPFPWRSLGSVMPFNDVQQGFFDEARSAGLLDGVSFPIHGPMGELSMVSIASDDPRRDLPALLPVLTPFVAQFSAAYSQFLPSPEPDAAVTLTQRERECLSWSAQGKSSWDIGLILKLSEHTVNFHLKNALGKLGCSSRVAAIVKAFKLGLIAP